MFDVNKLEKEDLIEYIKKLDDLMNKKDSYIEVLEEKVYMEEKLNILDVEIKSAQRHLRSSMARLETFEDRHSEPIVMDLNEDKETDKVRVPKFIIGDIVTCSFINGKHVVEAYNSDNDSYYITNLENGHSYPVFAQTLTKLSKE